jgi:hypothetical protein
MQASSSQSSLRSRYHAQPPHWRSLLICVPLAKYTSLPHQFPYTKLTSTSQSWGITISGTILQNELKKTLPASFISQFPQGVEITYAAIPKISMLPEPLRSEVRQAFAMSIATIWKTMIGISGIGLLTVFFLREIPLNTNVDANYGLKDEKAAKEVSPESALNEGPNENV